MRIRFYIDGATDLPHIYKLGINEDEVEDVLRIRVRIVRAKKVPGLLWGRQALDDICA
ncbi:MAG: hypothetical protein ACLQPD_20155 [Desulfomonilaceae bacterium]